VSGKRYFHSTTPMLLPVIAVAFVALAVPVRSADTEKRSSPFPSPGNATYDYVGMLL
jgi:hypothetical protein